MSADKLYEHAQKNFPVDPSEVGFITLDFTLAYQLSLRAKTGAARWSELTGNAIDDGVFIGDPGQMMATDDSRAAVIAIVSAHPEYEYWVVYGVIENMALGAADGLKEQKIDTDHCVATYMGGSAAQVQWAAGNDIAVKYVLDTPTIIYSEPLFFTLYAFVNGDATPESIYPSWRSTDPVNGTKYAMLGLNAFWKTPENYNDVAAWANAYIGSDYYEVGQTSTTITPDTYQLYRNIPSTGYTTVK
jgi:hypothetical protein